MSTNAIVDMLDIILAFMCILSFIFKTWVRYNNRRFWMKPSVTQWKAYHFEWFSQVKCEQKIQFPHQKPSTLFNLIHIEALTIPCLLAQKARKHIRGRQVVVDRSWLAGRRWQVVVAELMPVTRPRTSHIIGSNQLFNHKLWQNCLTTPISTKIVVGIWCH